MAPDHRFRNAYWWWILVVVLLPLHSAGPFERLGPSSRFTDLVFSEIMYKPADRDDKRELEYIELFNSSAFPIDLAGYRVDGVIEHTFDTPFTLAGKAFLVLARSPQDVRSIYQITNVIGWPVTISTTNVVGKPRTCSLALRPCPVWV